MDPDLIHPEAKYPEFAERLNNFLSDSGLSVKELAAALGISAQMVGKYLRGESMPVAKRLLDMADALKVDVGALVGGESPRAPGPKRSPSPVRAITTTRSPSTGRLHTQESLFEPEALSMLIAPGVPDVPRVPLTSSVWDGVSRGVSRLHTLILHALREYCDRSPLARAVDANAVSDLRVRGPYGRALVDIAITISGRPVVGIEIKSGIGGQLAGLTGVALNWKLATGGAPLLVVWVVPTTPEDRSRMGPIKEDLRALREPAPSATLGPLIDSTWILPSDDPEAGLVGLLTRVSEILVGPKPE